MALSDTDLLLVQRGETPFKTTADQIAAYSNTKIELGDSKDIPLASTSQLGVIKVGQNLEIESDGTLKAIIPSGTEYMGPWTNPDTPPSATANGQFWMWEGGSATLNNVLWGTPNGEAIEDNDRLFYNGTSFDLLPAGGGSGLIEITATLPLSVTPVSAGEQDISISAASNSNNGYMSKEDHEKLEGIEAGAQANVNPTQSYTPSSTNGVLTLVPGGDTTTVPGATETQAGLMSAADKAIIDDLVANPGGVVSLISGDGIDVNTTDAPGTAGTPEINVKFYVGPGAAADENTLVMPSNISLLGDLP